jgi:hypothetical protein
MANNTVEIIDDNNKSFEAILQLENTINNNFNTDCSSNSSMDLDFEEINKEILNQLNLENSKESTKKGKQTSLYTFENVF